VFLFALMLLLDGKGILVQQWPKRARLDCFLKLNWLNLESLQKKNIG